MNEIDASAGHNEPSMRRPHLRVTLLGGFQVVVDERVVDLAAWSRRKSRSLVKLLALAPHHTLHREQIIDALWPDLDPIAGASNLRLALHHARNALGPSTLLSRGEQIVLGPETGTWVDIEAFEEVAAGARRSADPEEYAAVLALYRGDLLPEDRYEDWAANHRERLRDLYLALLLEMGHVFDARGQYTDAIDTLQKVMLIDPANEAAGVARMRAFARSGQRQQALRQYEQLRAALRDEMDATPERETERLYAEILAGATTPVLPDSTTPDRAGPRHNLPAPLTSFVGREQEIARVRQAFDDTRLLTLVGSGGCGKTRLALAVAADMVDAEPDGVFLVELAASVDGRVLPATVASVLSVTLDPNQDALDLLAGVLSGKRLLLVLDNCEHLSQACALFAHRLLHACPTLRMLATSREPLDIDGEMVWRVPSLPVPEAEPAASFDEIARSDAVRLFCDRARFVQSDFALTPANAAAVADICRRLDGLPLAIELAAARLPILGVDQLAARLDDALRLLGNRRRTSPARHETLRATFDWSHALLDAHEQTLFRRLAVFIGGWTIEAAEVVCGGDGIDSNAVLDLLERLLDKSLVVVAAETTGVRYHLLETVRQYAREKLDASAEAPLLAERHADYYLVLAEEAETELSGPRQAEWLARLEQEHGNLRATLRWATQEPHAEVEGRLCAALWRFWYYHGHLAEGERWLDDAIARHSEATITPRIYAKLLQGSGALAWNRGDLERSQELSTRALGLFEEADDLRSVSAVQHNLGLVAEWRGDLEEATRRYEAGLALREALGNKAGAADALQALGGLARQQGDLNRAAELHERSLALHREVANKRGIAIALSCLGVVALDEGAYALSAALSAESLELLQELGDAALSAISLNNLGYATLHQGDPQRAATHQADCLRLARDAGDPRGIAYGIEGLAAASAMLHPNPQSAAVAGAERAARLFGAAEALRARVDIPLPPVDSALNDRSIATARAVLTDAVFDAAWAAGRLLSREAAIDEALAVADTEDVPLPAAIPLSSREREIATLLALGRTNAQIAASLSISERTVDTHVSNILRKLALTSRVEIRAWASAHGLLDP